MTYEEIYAAVRANDLEAIKKASSWRVYNVRGKLLAMASSKEMEDYINNNADLCRGSL